MSGGTPSGGRTALTESPGEIIGHHDLLPPTNTVRFSMGGDPGPAPWVTRIRTSSRCTQAKGAAGRSATGASIAATNRLRLKGTLRPRCRRVPGFQIAGHQDCLDQLLGRDVGWYN